MKKSLLSFICALCALLFIPNVGKATDYTAFEDATVPSFALPLYMSNSTDTKIGSSYYGSITQQIYHASDITDDFASEGGEISAISFWYKSKSGEVAGINRNIAVYLMTTDVDEYSIAQHPTIWNSYFLCDNTNKAGTKVYDGRLKTKETVTTTEDSVKLNFNVSNFLWDGTSNIVVTVVDKTGGDANYTTSNFRFIIASTKVSDVAHPRFADVYWNYNATPDTRASWITDGNYDFSGKLCDTYGTSNENTQKSNRSYVAKATFSISAPAAPTAPSTPSDLAASNIGSTSASLSWSAVDGATSYDLFNSTSIDGVYSKFASSATNSYEWSGLTASTTYFVKVAAVNGVGSSALSDPISFATQAPHIHDGITFEPWSNPSAMPTSGNYYLNTDVELASDWNVTENINLCLNGHEVYTETNSIQVKDGATFAIYDNEGGGRIYGYFVANYPKYGLINIENGGTLVLSEGTIQNLYGSYEEDDDPDDKSLSNAIYNNGTLKLSGALTFTSYHADIYLGSNKYITIESEKPLTNSEPYSVYKSGKSVITSGWANMNGADPKDYFVSANTSLNIKMGETEAEFYPVISLSENNTNTAIGTYSGQMVDVNLTRSLTSSQYNTFCLPFALDDDQLQEFFGAGYDLEEFVSSSMEDDVLNLVFNKVTSLEAGKPYLLQPSVDVANPSFEGVTIAANAAGSSSTTYVDYHSTYAPTELQGGNRNLLFLGADNELFYPASTANIKAFRAYFELKGAAVNSAPKARIVKKQDSATGIENQMVNGKCGNGKFLKDGQLYILRDGKMYNVLGMEK